MNSNVLFSLGFDKLFHYRYRYSFNGRSTPDIDIFDNMNDSSDIILLTACRY